MADASVTKTTELFGVSWITVSKVDVDPKSGPRKENTEHWLEVRKIY